MNRSGQLGTGFLIRKEMKKFIKGFEPVNERICKLRIRGKYCDLSLFSVHAPTEDKEEREKDVFYNELEKAIRAVSTYDLIIFLGDLNAKVGKEQFTKNVAGKYSPHEITNDNGKRLCSFAGALNMIIKSTCFPHKKIHLQTWKSPGNRVVNQIDHILVNRRRASTITNVRTFRGANVDSDHFLVKATLRHRISRIAKEKGHKRNIWDIKKIAVDNNMRRIYQEAIGNRLSNINLNADIETCWKDIQKCIIDTANEVIGKKRRMRNEDWFDEECKEILQKKNEARKKMLQKETRQNQEIYHQLRKESNKILK